MSSTSPAVAVVLVALAAACSSDRDEPPAKGAENEAPARPDRPPLAIQAECDLPPRNASAHVSQAERDLVYASMGGEELQLDLYRPSGAGPHPLVVLVHGGAWAHGDEDWMGQVARALTSRGWATATVEYRLIDERAHSFPGPIADVRCAVRWLRSHAAERRLDADRVVAWGSSAGGHLAALLATAPEDSALDGECPDTETSPAVQGAVAYYAPHDLRASTDWRAPAERVIAELLGGPREERSRRAALASPIAHVDRSDPPMVLVHGTDDAVVPIEQSRRMRDRLERGGVPHALVEVEGAKHGFHLLSREQDHRRAVCTSLTLLDRVAGHDLVSK